MTTGPAGDSAMSFEARYYQVAGQLETAKAVETLLREQIVQLKEQLRVQENTYTSRLNELSQQLAALQSRAVAGTAPTAPTAALAAVAPSSDFTAVWLQEKRYQEVCSRFSHYLYPHTQTPDLASLTNFWRSMEGYKTFFSRHSQESLSLLLSRDERSSLTLSPSYSDAQDHKFVECVVARLPHLRHLSLGGVSYSIDLDFMKAAHGYAPALPFPALRTLDISQSSTLTAAQLRALLSVAKGVTTLHVGGCEALTWSEVCAVAREYPGIATIVPGTEAEFVASTDEQFIARVAQEYVKNRHMIGDLLKLWHTYGGPQGLQNGMTPRRLTAVLGQSEITRMLIGGVKADDVPSSAFVPAEELTAFVSSVISRLPKLEHLTLRHCTHGWPFDFNVLAGIAGTGIEHAFPGLKHVTVQKTKWRPEDLTRTIQLLPSLEVTLSSPSGSHGGKDSPMALEVHIDDGPADVNVLEVRQACGGKLYIWAN